MDRVSTPHLQRQSARRSLFRRFQRRMVGTVGEDIPVDQQYSRFITAKTAFLRQVPSPVLRNGAVRWRQAYQRFLRN
ncbi:hypothetical protein [Sulfobacillus thermosulfidooxidans]|uniref:hypothetical protein n=1 Tax=Sulfobacillus thermosulfidooxidans TaxID=28034 RepID=UPI00031F8274|nr:hypothetical protein [Sulfobacillus thermosulfidooxidans]